MVSNKILFKEQQKVVMEYLKKFRKDVFSMKNDLEEDKDCILPNISVPIEKLKEYLKEVYGFTNEQLLESNSTSTLLCSKQI